MSRVIQIAAVLTLLLPASAYSQSMSATDYAKQFYPPGLNVPEPDYSPRVKKMIRACEKKSTCEYGTVMYVGQDVTGTVKDIAAKQIKSGKNFAVVRVSFKDDASPAQVTYKLIRGKKSWLVDDMIGRRLATAKTPAVCMDWSDWKGRSFTCP